MPIGGPLNPFDIFGGEPIPRNLGYTSKPKVSAVSPSSGRIAGGTAVTITGAYFGVGGLLSVTFGGVAATSVVLVDTLTITCVTPASAAIGPVNVVVTNGTGETGTLSNGFTYISSQISRVTPPAGVSTGGTAVSVYGTNFVVGSAISFGGVAATAVTYISSTQYTCITPAGSAGTAVDVLITEPGGATDTLRHGFIYSRIVINEAFVTTLGGPHTAQTRRKPSIHIQTELGNTPNTATFTIGVDYTPPNVNDDVSFTDNGLLKFAGTVLHVEQTYEDWTNNFVYNVYCADYAWLLNRYRPRVVYTAVSVATALTDIINRYAPGYSLSILDSVNLSGQSFANTNVTMTFTGQQSLTDALSALCSLVGNAHWKVSYTKSIHVFIDQDTSLTAPDNLVDGLSTLRNNPAPKSVTDLSQIRNKVTVAGQATSSVTDPLLALYPYSIARVIPGSTSGSWSQAGINGLGAIPVASIEGFDVGGGDLLIGGCKASYTTYSLGYISGVSNIVDTSKTPVLYLYNLSEDAKSLMTLYQPPQDPNWPVLASAYYMWPAGLAVQAIVTQEDDNSIAQYGIHEFFVNDSNLKTPDDLRQRGLAELTNFAWPIVTLTYDTWDEKTVAGARVDVNLSSPSVSGKFTIQQVSIGSYYDETDQAKIRYSVTATKTYTAQTSVARLSHVDLLLYLDKNTTQISGVGSAPPQIPVTTQTFATSTGQTLNIATLTISAAQMNTLFSVPLALIPAPGAGQTIVPITLYCWQNIISTFSILNNIAIRYNNMTTSNSMVPNVSFTNANNRSGWTQFPINSANFAINIDPRNQSVLVQATGDCTGGSGSFLMALLYTTVTG
jgi:hypothetical protein